MAQFEREVQGRETVASLGSVVKDKAESLLDASRQTFDNLRKKSLEDLYEDTKGFVRHNPGKSLLGGLAVGFLLGTFFRRR
jgi:ElaB/YqjD/DUF883 family membrane-anchored ribosome-binding protein